MSDTLFPSPITDDPWHLHFHAVGLITAFWNNAENTLSWFVGHLAGIEPFPHPAQGLLIDKLGNVTKADALVPLATSLNWEPEGIAAAAHFVRMFNICRENRNVVLHARFSDVRGSPNPTLLMVKTTGRGGLTYYDADLPMLRQVAEDMRDMFGFLLHIIHTSQWRDPEQHHFVAEMLAGSPERQSWPKTLPLPRKLAPRPLSNT